MQKEVKNHIKHRKAFTLVELILASAMTAIIVVALVGIVYNSYRNWKLGSGRSTLLQDGRAVMEQMTRIIRQAKGFSSVSSSTDQAGEITFTDTAGAVQQFRRNGSTNEIEYGQPGSLNALAGSVSGLVFTCYDVNANSLANPVKFRKIRGVGITATLIDPVVSQQFTLSDRVFCLEDFQNEIVVNEFMYNPSGGGSDAPKEWVELYNLSDSAIDVNGWIIWTDKVQHNDTLIADPQFGNGSTIIPANGYAIITAKDTKVTGVDPNAVRLSVPDSRIGNGLANNNDTVAVDNSSGSTVDSVTYVDSWGGDGDGTSLSRIDPQGSSNDQSNWTSGPVNGTPGSAN
jgi:Tfp pilus assembly protein PilE